jgi:polysaccharide pyruvyl transferase WcaK-like protein
MKTSTTTTRNNPRPLRIAFMTTVGRNVGDEFIREGIRSFFDDCLPAYDAYYVDKHDLTTLQRPLYDEIEQLADKFTGADVIVQAGAPVYWSNGKHTSCTADWAQALWYDRIFALGGKKLVLNLGAGAGQKSENDLDALLNDASVTEFARRAGRACAWTTIRDGLAGEFLNRIGVKHALMPCPAFHAARRITGIGTPPPPSDVLAVNLMKLAGHWRMKLETNADQWRSVIDELLPRLRKQHKLLFVAHDDAEAEFHGSLAERGESIFLSKDYRDYLSVYSRVKGIVANRVHGAVCVAGFGRPAVIVGNDCRIGIARPIGVPACDSADVSADWIVNSLEAQFAAGAKLQTERLELRDASATRYVRKIQALLAAHFGSDQVGGGRIGNVTGRAA